MNNESTNRDQEYWPNFANDLRAAGLIMAFNLIAAVVMVPYMMFLAKGNPHAPQLPWLHWLGVQLTTYFLFALITIPVGVGLGPRVGLEAPVFRGLARSDFSVLTPLRTGWIAGLIGGIAGGTVIFLATLMLPPDVMGTEAHPESVKETVSAPFWIPAIASIGAGITEETWCRYGIMAFIVWFGCLLADRDRPHTAYFWFANVAASIPFSAMHIGNLLVTGGEISPQSLAILFFFNGLIAVICGWLYWKYGIESAMASHATCDLTMKVVWPLILFSN